MVITNKQKFNILFGNDKNSNNSLKYISEKMRISMNDINKVIERGEAAFYTNRASVRPHVTSATQWGYSRLYAFIQHVIKIRKDKSYIPNSDHDLVIKYNKN